MLVQTDGRTNFLSVAISGLCEQVPVCSHVYKRYVNKYSTQARVLEYTKLTLDVVDACAYGVLVLFS